MHPGQPATVRLDAYPDKLFKGYVDSIQARSGAAFSLLPPENATGNYVKVVQRVPVKIVIDEVPAPKPGDWSRDVGGARGQGPVTPTTPGLAPLGQPRHSPWLIGVVVAMAAFMEVLDTSIANVALPYMAGSLGASNDQSTWVLTSYLLSNAVVLPLCGWLADFFGRKRFRLMGPTV